MKKYIGSMDTTTFMNAVNGVAPKPAVSPVSYKYTPPVSKPSPSPSPKPSPSPSPKPSPSPSPKPSPSPSPKPSPSPSSTSSSTYGSWTQGTATYYNSPDSGSCGYGALPNSNVKTGTDIAAISSVAPNYGGVPGQGYYKAKSCGICYEVQCSSTPTADGTGELVDSKTFCSSGSVVVTVTDTCPQADGNPKCGATHLDLSQQAFCKIAQQVAGQVAIKYREVPCTYTA